MLKSLKLFLSGIGNNQSRSSLILFMPIDLFIRKLLIQNLLLSCPPDLHSILTVRITPTSIKSTAMNTTNSAK